MWLVVVFVSCLDNSFFLAFTNKGQHCPFCAGKWFVGFRFIHCSLLSLAALSLSPALVLTLFSPVSPTGVTRSPRRRLLLLRRGSRVHVSNESSCGCCQSPSASHSKGSRQEYHGNQGAKRVSRRRSERSPKPGAVHVPGRLGIVAAGECPDRCPTGRTPRKLPKFGDRGQPPCKCHTDPLPGCNVPGK